MMTHNETHTFFELSWDGEENSLQYTFFYHFIWNYPTFSWGTSQHPHVRSLFPKHIPNRTPISKAKRDRTWVHWSSYFDKHIQSTFSGWWFGTFFICSYIGNSHPNWLIFFRGVETTNQFSIKWYFVKLCQYHSILACCWWISPPSNLVSVIPKKVAEK